MQVIIDLDFLVYRAGFASEKRCYDVLYELPNGTQVSRLFSPVGPCDLFPDGASAGDVMKRELATVESDHGEYILLDKTPVVHPEPFSHCAHIAQEMIAGMVAHAKTYTKRPQIRNLLTGSRNYRYHIATIKPYKGNRESALRPHHYQELREFLIKRYGAEVIEGHEADDEASIAMWDAYTHGRKALLISQDKDLDQAPGLHYDPVKKVSYEVSEDDAEMAFWIQTLCGDATDNVPGCYKIGRAKAERIVRSIPSEALWNTVVCIYDDSIDTYGDKCGYNDAGAAALETAQLVRMQRYPYELWIPYGTGCTKELEEKEYGT